MSGINPSDSKVTYVLNEEFIRLRLSVKPGQILDARVLNQLDEHHYLLSIRNQKVIAELNRPLSPNSHVLLLVQKIARKLSLKLLGVPDDARQKLLQGSAFAQLNDRDQQILIQKMVQYQIPFDLPNENILSQIMAFINQHNTALILFTPEIWLLMKRWKMVPEPKNLVRILDFVTQGMNKEAVSFLKNFMNGMKTLKNSSDIFKLFIYEQLIGTETPEIVKEAASGIQKNWLLSLFRFEIAQFMESGSGLLPLINDKNELFPVFIKRTSENKNIEEFRFMIFSFIHGDALVVDSLWRKDYIQVEFRSQTQKIHELMIKYLPHFSLQEKLKKKCIIKHTIDAETAVFYFKQLMSDTKKIKRTM